MSSVLPGCVGDAKGPGDPGQSAGDFARWPPPCWANDLPDDEHGDCGQATAGAVMRADVGDVLVVAGSESRTGLIIGIVGQDGAPPYVIKWLSDGHIAMVTPDPYSRIVPSPDGTPPEQLRQDDQ